MEKLKKYLIEKKITQVDFAHRIGVTPGRLSQIISGDRPSFALMLVIQEETGGRVAITDYV